MRARIILHKLSLLDVAEWSRENGVPFVAVKRMNTRHTDGRRKLFFYSSRRIIDERLSDRHETREAHICILIRPVDFTIVRLRFGVRLTESWD